MAKERERSSVLPPLHSLAPLPHVPIAPPLVFNNDGEEEEEEEHEAGEGYVKAEKERPPDAYECILCLQSGRQPVQVRPLFLNDCHNEDASDASVRVSPCA